MKPHLTEAKQRKAVLDYLDKHLCSFGNAVKQKSLESGTVKLLLGNQEFIFYIWQKEEPENSIEVIEKK